ncbi:MAG: hypothetical protein ACFFCO_03025 [Promethearchaeota archaeon]
MTHRLLPKHRCPVCGGNITKVVLDEDKIKNAPRVPVLVPVYCDRGCFLVLFVDRSFTIREAQPALQIISTRGASTEESTG